MRFFLSVSRITSVCRRLPLLLLAGLVLGPASAFAEYKLQPGDSLAVSVTGLPNFKEQPLIGVEGTITLPLAGQLKISGLPLSEAKAAIVGSLSNKLYQQMANDGREIQHLILANEIVVTVVGYRAVYVSGHVVKPGEYPFRPGITVRQAIAIAGGYDLVRSLGLGPFPSVDKIFLEEAIRKIDFQLNVLAEKKKGDEEGHRADAEYYEKAKDLSRKGLTVVERLLDARRAVLMSSTQFLQTIVEISNTERQRDEYARQLQKLELALAPGAGGRPDITIYRKGEGEDGPQHLGADEDLELAPGDVVDVAPQRKNVAEAQPHQPENLQHLPQRPDPAAKRTRR